MAYFNLILQMESENQEPLKKRIKQPAQQSEEILLIRNTNIELELHSTRYDVFQLSNLATQLKEIFSNSKRTPIGTG